MCNNFSSSDDDGTVARHRTTRSNFVNDDETELRRLKKKNRHRGIKTNQSDFFYALFEFFRSIYPFSTQYSKSLHKLHLDHVKARIKLEPCEKHTT